MTFHFHSTSTQLKMDGKRCFLKLRFPRSGRNRRAHKNQPTYQWCNHRDSKHRRMTRSAERLSLTNERQDTMENLPGLTNINQQSTNRTKEICKPCEQAAPLHKKPALQFPKNYAGSFMLAWGKFENFTYLWTYVNSNLAEVIIIIKILLQFL